MTLGKNIKRFREEREISQTALAENAGISRVQLGQIERNIKTNPGIQTVKRIAEILDVNIDDLFLGEEPKTDMQTLRRFERLNGENRKLAIKFIDFCLEEQKTDKKEIH